MVQFLGIFKVNNGVVESIMKFVLSECPIRESQVDTS